MSHAQDLFGERYSSTSGMALLWREGTTVSTVAHAKQAKRSQRALRTRGSSQGSKRQPSLFRPHVKQPQWRDTMYDQPQTHIGACSFWLLPNVGMPHAVPPPLQSSWDASMRGESYWRRYRGIFHSLAVSGSTHHQTSLQTKCNVIMNHLRHQWPPRPVRVGARLACLCGADAVNGGWVCCLPVDTRCANSASLFDKCLALPGCWMPTRQVSFLLHCTDSTLSTRW